VHSPEASQKSKIALSPDAKAGDKRPFSFYSDAAVRVLPVAGGSGAADRDSGEIGSG